MYIPHCPQPDCSNFDHPTEALWFRRYGHYSTKTFGAVARYQCKACGRTFSDQAFSIDYYAKKLIDYDEILSQLTTGSGLNDMGRHFAVRPESIQNRIERLARCAMGIHADLLGEAPMTEDLAADGFESFSYSQYHPHHINVLAGCDSEFIYSLSFANLRRKGRMTRWQKQKRQRLEQKGRADPGAIRKSFAALGRELTDRLEEKGVSQINLYTDEHREYPRAFAAVPGFANRVTHWWISSRAARRKENPLFPVNYIDRQFRKDLSDHGRETVQFAKDPSAMMMRMVVYRFFHNCVIHRRIREYRRGHRVTHARVAGIDEAVMDRIIARHWRRRPFVHKIRLGSQEQRTWFRQWQNPGMTTKFRVPSYIAA